MGSTLAHLLLAADLALGTWNARLDTQQGALEFGLELARRDDGLAAVVVNGEERIDVALVRGAEDEIVLDFPHYAARITARLDASGKRLDGAWRKRSGPERFQTLPFRAELAPERAVREAEQASVVDFTGRWRVQFARDPEAAVAIVRNAPGAPGRVDGTILTATGDYRFLSGRAGRELVLSCFDGAHAFRLEAVREPDGSLRGRFSSGETWTDTWTAVRDEEAHISGEYERARWDASYAWNDLVYPALDGVRVSLGDPRYDGKVRILQVAGSWCPNCHDETVFLAELDHRYRSKGLSITALCFEMTGERETDAAAAGSMLARHRAAYEALLVGRSDKALAREALPALDRVFAFPTTIFVGRDGRVRAVHAGFSGPATGDAHRSLRAEFEKRVEELLAEEPTRDEPWIDHVTREIWRDETRRTFTSFARDEAGQWSFSTLEMTRFDGPTRTDPVETGTARFHGTTVRLGAPLWSYDRRAHVLLDPDDCGHRLTPAARSPFPVVDGVGHAELDLLLAGLSSGEAILRRESAYYLALQIVADRMTPPEFGGGSLRPGLETNLLPLLSDPDPRVRATASWAAGVTGHTAARSALAKNLEHGFAPVRREAARALALLDPKAAAETLARLARHDPDPLVRAAAAR